MFAGHDCWRRTRRASLACALEPLDLDITVLNTPLTTISQVDERTIALTYGSRRVLEGIGLWPEIASDAGPIHRIHISNRGHSGFARLDRNHIGTDALGYVIPTRTLGHALTERLRNNARVDYRCPAEVNSIDHDSQSSSIRVEVSGEQFSSSLVVLADGGRSSLGQSMGLKSKEKQYDKEALIGIVGVDRDQDATAYERFTRHGPLALLPLDARRYALAWTLPKAQASEMVTLPEKVFLEALQDAFGDRVGFFSRCDRLKAYPLRRVEVETPVGDRLIALGNAAHIVHPVAGQGFNLGLLDVAHLAEEIFHCLKHNKDIGNSEMLAQYVRLRHRQTKRVLRFTDGLLQVFANDYPGMSSGRNLRTEYARNPPSSEKVAAETYRWPFGAASTARPRTATRRRPVIQTQMPDCDALIVGAGMIGGACALALARQGLNVSVIDRDHLNQNTKAEPRRVSAINLASENILKRLEVWDEILASLPQTFERIEVRDEGNSGTIF